MGCRGKKPVSELVRIIRHPDGSLEPGPGLSGRGAWLCADGDAPGPQLIVDSCLEEAIRRKAFGRAFRAEVTGDAAAGLRTKAGKRARMEGRAPVGAVEERRED